MACHYIESAARVAAPSLTGRVLQRVPGIRRYTQYRALGRAALAARRQRVRRLRARPATGRRSAGVVRVVVTVGTADEFPFRRLVERLAPLLRPDGELARATGRPRRGAVADRVHADRPPADHRGPVPAGAEQLAEAIAAADLVVSHAGVGSALTALAAGRRPLLAAAVGRARRGRGRPPGPARRRAGAARARPAPRPGGDHGRRPAGRPVHAASAARGRRRRRSSWRHDADLRVDPRTDPLWLELPAGRGAACSPRRPWITAVCDTYGFEPDGAGRGRRVRPAAGRRGLDGRARHARAAAAGAAVLRPGRPDRRPTRRLGRARERRPAGRRPAVHPALPRRLPRARRPPVHRRRRGRVARDRARPAPGRTARGVPVRRPGGTSRPRSGRASRSCSATTRRRCGSTTGCTWSCGSGSTGCSPSRWSSSSGSGRPSRPADAVRTALAAGRRPAGRRRAVPGLAGHRLLQVRRLRRRSSCRCGRTTPSTGS